MVSVLACYVILPDSTITVRSWGGHGITKWVTESSITRRLRHGIQSDLLVDQSYGTSTWKLKYGGRGQYLWSWISGEKKDKIISQTGLDKIDILLSAKVNQTLKNYFSFPFPFIKQVNPSLLSFWCLIPSNPKRRLGWYFLDMLRLHGTVFMPPAVAGF